jgi:dephospho-CoA kinase
MGKSTVSSMVRRLGIPVHDADATVHALMQPGRQAFAAVQAAFPEVIIPTKAYPDGEIDRRHLGALVFADDRKRQQLQDILHPLVQQAEACFLRRARLQRRAHVVLDIPLLFETGGQMRCDQVWVVAAPPFLQKQRVMARPNMTAEKFNGILAAQLPSWQKCAAADAVLPSGLGKAVTFRRLKRLL